jgi:hypothetical protein
MNETEAFLRKYLNDPIASLKEWLTSFGKVLINPRPQTFREIADHSAGNLRAAVLWMVVFCCLLYLFSTLTTGVVLSPVPLLSFMLVIPTAILFWVFCMHFVYRLLFRGRFNLYDGLVCAAVCILIPVNLVRALLLVIPFAGPLLSWLVIAYQVILVVVAVQAITHLKYLQAILAVVVSTLITASAIYLLSIFLLRLASTTAMLLLS